MIVTAIALPLQFLSIVCFYFALAAKSTGPGNSVGMPSSGSCATDNMKLAIYVCCRTGQLIKAINFQVRPIFDAVTQSEFWKGGLKIR
jgi:hypothetical protein